MTLIAPAKSDTPLSRLRGATPAAADSQKPGAEKAGQALGPAASVTLSDAAKAMLKKADAGREAAAHVA